MRTKIVCSSSCLAPSSMVWRPQVWDLCSRLRILLSRLRIAPVLSSSPSARRSLVPPRLGPWPRTQATRGFRGSLVPPRLGPRPRTQATREFRRSLKPPRLGPRPRTQATRGFRRSLVPPRLGPRLRTQASERENRRVPTPGSAAADPGDAGVLECCKAGQAVPGR